MTAYIPALPPILKLFRCKIYVVLLAIRLWKTANAVQDLDQACIRAWELFFATLLNPKALLFASAIFPAIAWKNSMYYTAHMLVFLLLYPDSFCGPLSVLSWHLINSVG